MQLNHKIIFWDWNGTLLSDADACVEAMNSMLIDRRKKPIDLDDYKSLFGFPVINYYKALGFDFSIESFEALSVEFISNYRRNGHLIRLHDGAIDTLAYFKRKKKKQVIISAMEQEMLFEQLTDYDVLDFFNEVRGISDIYAMDKTHLAEAYLNENEVNEQEIVFIGDTLHDKEVADKVGIDNLLIAHGHQSAERLAVSGNMVINDLKSLLSFAETL
jgi:phosphoglycolate phosphatase